MPCTAFAIQTHTLFITFTTISLSLLLRLEYVKINNTKHGLPTDEMPKFKCLEEDGRSDLKRAISKFGGKKNISKKAGLTVT